MQICRIFLVGEGPCDIGDLAVERSYRDTDDERLGFLRPMLAKLVARSFKLEFDGRKLSHFPRKRTRFGKKFLQRKAAQALALAAEAEADVLIFSRDTDRTAGTAASEAERRKLHAELSDELRADVEAAQRDDDDLRNIPVLFAIPIRMIEAWALGDAAAIAQVLEEEPGELPRGSPETWWGKEEIPSSKHPKCVFKRIFGQEANGTLLGRIAELADPVTLCATCPESFRPFRDAVEAQVRECRRHVSPSPSRSRT